MNTISETNQYDLEDKYPKWFELQDFKQYLTYIFIQETKC